MMPHRGYSRIHAAVTLLLLASSLASVVAKHRFVSAYNLTGRMGRKMHQLPQPLSFQMFLDGPLESATLDTACVTTATKPNCGGSLVVNGINVTVPQNIMVMLPANALTWQELFDTQNGGTGWVTPGTMPATNLALNDANFPVGVTYHVTVTANEVKTASGKSVIAGMIDMFQDPLYSGTGFIEAITYATGELTVATTAGGPGGLKLRINDPTGRFGIKQSGLGFDPRFVVDPDNPTITSTTGFPMCIPRTDPASAFDLLCHASNRPKDTAGNILTNFFMNAPGTGFPDPTVMAPFAVGDYITFSGVRSSQGFIAAYSITNNVAIYTQAGLDPAYIIFEEAIIGTGGLIILGATEPAIRSRWGGFTTDPSRPISLFGLDFDPATGKPTKRPYGQVMPDPGPPTGATMGHWRIQPPCTTAGPLAVGSPFLGNSKGCTPPPGGVYLPPTREVWVEVAGCQPAPGPNLANGIASGGCFYRNPTIEYLWPENIPGSPIVENSFSGINFLAQGGYTSGGGTLVGTLTPWPSNVLPSNSCLPPTISAGTAAYPVTAGGMVTLDGTADGPGQPYTYTWTPASAAAGGTCGPNIITAGTPNQVAVSCGPVTASTTYTFTVANTCGNTFTATATVNVIAAVQQAIQTIAPQTVPSGKTGVSITANLSGTTPDVFTWTAPPDPTSTATPQPLIAITSTNPTTTSTWQTITFNAPVIPVGTITQTALTFTVTAGTGMSQSAPSSALVYVNPQPDTITITAVTFRCDKHRLIITATTSINNPQLKLTLPPYMDNSGKQFNTATIGNTLTYGLVGAVATYTITMEPVPLPSLSTPFWVNSAIGGQGLHQLLASEVVASGGGGGGGTICTI